MAKSNNTNNVSNSNANNNLNAPPWTNEELAKLFEMRKNGLAYSHIAKKINKSEDACRKKYQRTKWEDTEFFSFYEKLESKEKKVNLEEKLLKNIYVKKQSAETISDLFSDKLIEAIKPLPKTPLTPWKPSGGKNKSPEDIGLLFSDAHIGQDYSLEETGNLAEYSVDIFKNRLQVLKNAVGNIYELHSHLYNIPKLHVFALGDMVHGMNNVGSWSPVYISTPILDQVMIGFHEIAECIRYWLTIFPEIEFYGLAGNHSRISNIGDEKPYSNWDSVLYHFLSVLFKDEPRIKFNIPKTWWMIKKIRNHNFFMVHGDEIKGTFGSKAFSDFLCKNSGIIKNDIDYLLFGHFHNSADMNTNYGKAICSGSFSGGDPYSLRMGYPNSPPEQRIFGIHDQRGVTWTYNINLKKK